MNFVDKVARARKAKMLIPTLSEIEQRKIEILETYATAFRISVQEISREDGFKRVFGDAVPYVAVGRSEPERTESVEMSVISGDDATPDTCSSLILTAKVIMKGDQADIKGTILVSHRNGTPSVTVEFANVEPGEAVSIFTDFLAEQIAEMDPSLPRFS